MPTLRDSLLPVINALRALPDQFGIRRNTVTIRTRTWSGTYAGQGTATVANVALSPKPRVRTLKTHEIASSGGTYREGDIMIEAITPSYGSGGYTPEQLHVQPTAANKDVSIILVDDEANASEAQVIQFWFDRPFTYKMVVRLTKGPVRG